MHLLPFASKPVQPPFTPSSSASSHRNNDIGQQAWVACTLDDIFPILDRVGYTWGPLAGLPWGAPVPLILLTAYSTLLHRYNPQSPELDIAVSFGWYYLQSADMEWEDDSQTQSQSQSQVLSVYSDTISANSKSASDFYSDNNSVPSARSNLEFLEQFRSGELSASLTGSGGIGYRYTSSHSGGLGSGVLAAQSGSGVEPWPWPSVATGLSSQGSEETESIRTASTKAPSGMSLRSNSSFFGGENRDGSFVSEDSYNTRDRVVDLHLSFSSPSSSGNNEPMVAMAGQKDELSLIQLVSSVGSKLFESAARADSIIQTWDSSQGAASRQAKGSGDPGPSEPGPSCFPNPGPSPGSKPKAGFKFIWSGSTKAGRAKIRELSQTLPYTELMLLFVKRSNGTLLARWRYDRSLYDENSIVRLSSNLKHLIEQIALLPNLFWKQRLSQLPILSNLEREMVERRFSSGKSNTHGKRKLALLKGGLSRTSPMARTGGSGDDETGGSSSSSPLNKDGSVSSKPVVEEEDEWMKPFFNRNLFTIAEEKEDQMRRSDSFNRPRRESRRVDSGGDDPPALRSTLLDLCEKQAARIPDHVAVSDSLESLTYRQLIARATSVANYLMEVETGQEGSNLAGVDLVGLGMGRSVEWIVTLLGILMAGKAYLPLDPSDPPVRNQKIATHTGIRLVLTSDDSLHAFKDWHWGVRVLSVTCLRDDPDHGEHEGLRDRRPKSADACAVFFDSFVSGKPWGVILEHGSMAATVESLADRLPLLNEEIIGQCCDATSYLHMVELFTSLLSGAQLVICPSDGQLARAFHRDHISGLILPFSYLSAMDPAEVDSLCWIALTGPLAPAEFVRKWVISNRTVVQCYGTVESSGPVSCATWQPGDDVDEFLGTLLATSQAFVLGGSLELLAIGVPGEICLTGCQLARGYWGRPNGAMEKVVPNPFLTNRDDVWLFRTGDSGRWLGNGSLHIIKQNPEKPCLRGHSVSLRDIEALVVGFSEVSSCVALVGGPESNPCLLVYVTLSPRSGADSSSALGAVLRNIRAAMAGEMPSYMLPFAISIVSSDLSLLPDGTVHFTTLHLTSSEPNGTTRSPRETAGISGSRAESSSKLSPHVLNPEERIVVSVFAELFPHMQVKDIQLSANLFELGGNSLLVIQLLCLLKQKVGAGWRQPFFPLQASDVFESPTVRGIATLLKARAGDRRPSLGSSRDFVQTDSSVAETSEYRDLRSIPEGRTQRPSRSGSHLGFDSEFLPSLYPVPSAHWPIVAVRETLPTSESLSIVHVWRIKGNLNLDWLERGLEAIVARHVALRMRIVIKGQLSPMEVREVCSILWGLNFGSHGRSSREARGSKSSEKAKKRIFSELYRRATERMGIHCHDGISLADDSGESDAPPSAVSKLPLENVHLEEVSRQFLSFVRTTPQEIVTHGAGVLDIGRAMASGRSEEDAAVRYLVAESMSYSGADHELESLFQAVVVQVSPSDNRLILKWNHHMADSLSSPKIYQELQLLLEAGSTENLPGVAWPGSVEVPSSGSEESFHYWRAHLLELEGLSLMGRLQTRSPLVRLTRSSVNFRLDRNSVLQLERMAVNRRCSLFMLLMAAFHSLLHMWSGQLSVTVGTVVSNRTTLEDVVGSLSDIVPIVSDLKRTSKPHPAVFMESATTSTSGTGWQTTPAARQVSTDASSSDDEEEWSHATMSKGRSRGKANRLQEKKNFSCMDPVWISRRATAGQGTDGGIVEESEEQPSALLFDRVLEQVRERILLALQHQGVPVSQLVAQLAREAVSVDAPLVPAFFNLLQPGLDSPPLKLGLGEGVEAELDPELSWGLNPAAALCQVALMTRPDESGCIVGRLMFQADMFDIEVVEAATKQYEAILQSAVVGEPLQMSPGFKYALSVVYQEEQAMLDSNRDCFSGCLGRFRRKPDS